MKNLSKLILFVCFGILFAACNNDNLDTTDPNGNGGSDFSSNGPKVTRTFSFSIPDMESAGLDISRAELEEDADEAISFGMQPATRATVAATAAEKTVKSLYIMQFDAAGKRLNALTVPASDIKLDSSTGNVSVDVTIDEAANSELYVFANCAPNGKGDTKAKLMADSVILASAISAANVATTGLPMMGKATLASSTSSINVPMSFLVSKIKTTVTNSLSGFTISKVDLQNVPQHIYLTSAANTSTAAAYWNTYDAKTTATGELVFYVPENKRGQVSGLTSKTKSWWDAPDKAMSMRITGTISGKTIYYEIFPGANSTTDFNVERNTVYTINPTIKGVNGSADLRVWADGSTNLSSTQTANCYMADTPGKLYYFDASKKGNGKNTTGITDGTATLSPKGVEIVWETTSSKFVIRKAKLIGNRVYFSLAGNVGSAPREGNALIAVRDAASGGNILWSWHIWSTAYTGATETYTINTKATTVPAAQKTLKMMTRNLGAANNNVASADAFGMLYQWGRKDPFVGSAATSGTTFAASTMNQTWSDSNHTTASTAATGTIAYTIKNPTVFLTQCNTTTYDWIFAATVADQKNFLWGNPSSVTGSVTVTNLNTSKGTKTIYDPCPVGYMVPPQYTWTNFTTTGNNSSTSTEFNVSNKTSFATDHGWKFYLAGTSGATTYYPAAGYRYSASGALTAAGDGGWWWSASSFAADHPHAGDFGVRTSRAYPLLSDSRSYALSGGCDQ